MNRLTDPLRIFHITHVAILPGIVTARGLLSDARMITQGGPERAIGLSNIKQRRLTRLGVACHPGSLVGEYVPFYFCPRSVMLYILHKGNLPGLDYQEGQEPIVTLAADLAAVIDWADRAGVRWAYSSSNAGAAYTRFWADLDHLDELAWDDIRADDWRDRQVKERKQAEFLVHDFFPWELIEEIGVCTPAMVERASALLRPGTHRPPVEVQSAWYY